MPLRTVTVAAELGKKCKFRVIMYENYIPSVLI